jgi:tetraacyldisaccharide 4'-kinase
MGLLSTRRLPVPVVSVGNLTVGGSGKTPLAEVVALALGEMGARPAIVSRGYGRRTRGVHVVSDGRSVLLEPKDGGDEPVLLAERLPGVPVVVGESRYEAGVAAIGRCGAGSLVIDDGFQHRTLAKDLDIVAVSGREPWGNGRLFPRGSLREPLSALARAGVVVVTNPPAAAAAGDVADAVRRRSSHAIVLSGLYRPASLRRGGQADAPSALVARRVLALAGIAAPAGFVATAEAAGAEVCALEAFPDHHWYTAADLARVAVRARKMGAEAILTTEKDWVRLRDLAPGNVPVWTLTVRLDLGADRGMLVQELREAVERAAVGRRAP